MILPTLRKTNPGEYGRGHAKALTPAPAPSKVYRAECRLTRLVPARQQLCGKPEAGPVGSAGNNGYPVQRGVSLRWIRREISLKGCRSKYVVGARCRAERHDRLRGDRRSLVGAVQRLLEEDEGAELAVAISRRKRCDGYDARP
jgi:hypothetical protein